MREDSPFGLSVAPTTHMTTQVGAKLAIVGCVFCVASAVILVTLQNNTPDRTNAFEGIAYGMGLLFWLFISVIGGLLSVIGVVLSAVGLWYDRSRLALVSLLVGFSGPLIVMFVMLLIRTGVQI